MKNEVLMLDSESQKEKNAREFLSSLTESQLANLQNAIRSTQNKSIDEIVETI